MTEQPGSDLVEHKSPLTLKDVYTLYESGKGRRYGLLFSANGAAFAILSFLVRTPSRAVMRALPHR
jgi:hypothetical protein